MNSEENIVISGVAGRSPESHNAKKFEKNVSNKIDMATENTRRYKKDDSELSKGKNSYICDAIMKIIGLEDLKMTNKHVALSQLGMDSLSILEVKKILEQDFNIILNTRDIWTLNF